MGKAGRIACIFTPMALTAASLVCLILIEISGWGGNSGMLNSYYFFKANFTDLKISSATNLANTTQLTASLEYARDNDLLAHVYEIHLWNYCSSNSSSGNIDFCSGRHSDYYFNPIEVWGLNSTAAASSANGDSGSDNGNVFEHAADQIKNNTESLENEILGKSGKDALDAYRDVAKWMFIAYEVSFWSTLATLLVGVLAIFSRWGSFLTWILAFVSSAFTFAAVLTSTILFAALVEALKGVLDDYNVHLTLGTQALTVTWLSVAFSWAATLFWLFSVCCCSGRSNPHHRSNKGGLWQAEPKGQGYGDYGSRGRGLRVEKTGGGPAGGSYQRVASPFMGHDNAHDHAYPLQQQVGYTGASNSGAYEPFRHA